jgi:hypothetical protein
MGSQSRATARRQLQTVRETLAKLEGRVREIGEALQRTSDAAPAAEEWKLESDVCTLSSGLRIWCMRAVRLPPRKLRHELVRELAGLEKEMGELHLRAGSLARRDKQRRRADRGSEQFDKRLEQTLGAAERRGTIDEDELAGLLDESETVLGGYISLLRADPTLENIDAVLRHMVTPATLGGSVSSGASADALRALGEAAGRLKRQAEADFEKNPSVRNFDRLLSRIQMEMMLGEGNAGWATPPDLVRRRTTHTVAPGESLSSIAKHYYGKASYWPYIYMANFTTVDPNTLPAGIVLEIP